MGTFKIKLPDVGEGVAEAEVVVWMVAVGDTVAADQPVAEVMTDKASVEIYAPVAGTVSTLNGEPGDFIAVGSDLMTLAVEGDAEITEPRPTANPTKDPGPTRPPWPGNGKNSSDPTKDPGPTRPPWPGNGKNSSHPTKDPGPTRPPWPGNGKNSSAPLASPAVRRRARDNFVSLIDVPGSGPAGRISQADLDLYLAGGPTVPAGAQPAASSGPQDTPFSGIADADSEEVRVIGLRRRIAQQMAESKRRIPHFSYVEEIDVTALEDHRKEQNASASEGAPKLTVLPYLITALAAALKQHPEMNARFDDSSGVIHRYKNLHCGVAAQTPKGLTVPVIRNADQLDVYELAAEVARLGNGARDGSLAAEELRGASITISSLGPLGGVVTTPVINHPEVAILGVNKIVERPVVVDGQIVIRKMMNLSGSFDHRAVDGMDAAMFVQAIKAELEKVGNDGD